MRRALLLITALFLCAAAEAAAQSPADGSSPSGDDLSCLKCHAKRGVFKKFQNDESISVYIDANRFRASVHSRLTCPGCHTDFASGKHPERNFRGKEQYRIKASRICRQCHRDEEIIEKTVHTELLSKEKQGAAIICQDCHSAHSISPVSGGRVFASEEKYCMGCHAYKMEKTFRNGEVLPLKVEMSTLKSSAHGNLCCSDCHFGFSSESHVKKNFRTNRDYTIASSAMCRRCHYDKYAKTSENIHSITLKQGNFNAPTCTDCHGAHSVSYIREDRTSSARKCKKCHEAAYETYAKSVHGAALFNEHNKDVPVCINCHTAHEMKNPLTLEFHERIPETCSNCHADKNIMGKYGLSTDVVKTYLSDFHGITLEFYRMQKEVLYSSARPIAVCTDCHGTHDITSTVGPNATVVKSNLVNNCRKCHQNATENFPDIWLSHYVPSLSTAPMVFIVNTAYKFLAPVMVIGLLMQILLHIWRYLVDR
jgi:hypothetical protein